MHKMEEAYLHALSARQDASLVRHLNRQRTDNIDNRLPLNIAAGQADLDTVRQLIEDGCSVNVPDCRGKYPLHDAALTDTDTSAAVVKCLLDAGAEVDVTDSYQETPLMTACYWSNVDVIKLLAERTANINYQTITTGRAAIHYAAMGRQDDDVVGLLLQHGANPSLYYDNETPLIIATRSNSIQAVRSLLMMDCSVNHNTATNYTALHWAVYSKHTDIVKLLIDNNAMVNAPSMTICSNITPLHVGAKSGAVSSVELLLAAGAYMEVMDTENNTPLFLAVASKYNEIVKLLLYANCETDSVIYQERSPFLVAVGMKNTDIMEDLILAGCTFTKFWQKRSRNSQFIAWIQTQSKIAQLIDNHVYQAKTLQHMCCLRIRKSLSRGMKVHEDIESLDLPKAMKEYISLKPMLYDTTKTNV